MRAENIRKGKETSVIFALKRGEARVVLKRWEEDEDVLTLKQVHSSKVYVLEGFLQGLEGDAIITKRKGLKIGVRTADCVPIALLGRRAVAVIHAGWRGLKEGIVERTLKEFSTLESAEDILAFLGPSAKACCYEVGEDFKKHFLGLHFRRGRHYMDTQEEALMRLRRSGVKEFFVYRVCTVCHWAFPSHRRNKTKERLLTFVEMLE
ncbi:MAG: peptidoglycan editing factor PgeF [Aquificaceae bacterium]|nr:peptidoglycan editing factor PgeF [Aquificaceae bacterium]